MMLHISFIRITKEFSTFAMIRCRFSSAAVWVFAQGSDEPLFILFFFFISFRQWARYGACISNDVYSFFC